MQNDYGRIIETISALNRGLIGGVSFVFIMILILTVIFKFLSPDSVSSFLIPLFMIPDLIIFIVLIRWLILLPLVVIIKGEVLIIEWITHSKSFDRDEIINFEVHTKQKYSGNIRRWNHKLVLRTLDNKCIQLSSLSSGKQEPWLLRYPMNELEKC